MNLFNRIMLTLLCLVLVAGSVGVIAVAWAIPDESIEWLADAAVWLDDHNSTGTKALITLGGAVVALVAFLILLVEVLPSAQNEVRVTGLQAGDAVLTTAAIGQRIEEAVNQVPNISDVRASVRAKRKGVLVFLDLHVDPDANLAAVTDDASNAARQVLEERVHVALLAPPRTRLHYRELRLRGRPGQRGRVASAGPAPAPIAYESPPDAEPASLQDAPAVASDNGEVAEEEEKPAPA